jgi:hypothetical protein
MQRLHGSVGTIRGANLEDGIYKIEQTQKIIGLVEAIFDL